MQSNENTWKPSLKQFRSRYGSFNLSLFLYTRANAQYQASSENGAINLIARYRSDNTN